jgi:hypothetical protein
MFQENNTSLAIACASGSFKTTFVHGVLSAFEQAEIRADAYAAASGSVIPAAWAAIGQVNELGINYWLTGLELLNTGSSLSQTVQEGIARFQKTICNRLFLPSSSNFFVATSAVITQEAAEQTQGKQGKRLGRQLLVSAGKKDRNWADQHLRFDLFSNTADNNSLSLNANNFDEVAYASTRMLHAWDIPAWIAGKPYVDASYTCMCPAVEMVERGYQQVIAIATEPETLYRDMFQLEPIPIEHQKVPIHIIQPDVDPKELGVDFTKASEAGLKEVYRQGQQKGQEFISRWKTL